MSVKINGETYETWDDVKGQILTPEELAESEKQIEELRKNINTQEIKDINNAIRAQQGERAYISDNGKML